MSPKRSVFFVSDRTGITVEKLGRSLLSQFDGVQFSTQAIPFVNNANQAAEAARRINECAQREGVRPIVFSTLVQPDTRALIERCDAFVLDLFESFIVPLEAELGVPSSHAVGRSHETRLDYNARMDAVNYALNHDDGGVTRDLGRAQIILAGVSRSGKSPTSLYLALQFGIYAANYPLVDEDFQNNALPAALQPLLPKVYGLTIQPERLASIRAERMPNSRYAALENCREEVKKAEALMRKNGIPLLDVTTISVEEIATTLLHLTGLKR
ncbi:MAG: pyruvate, water dikinase regulatory protein [Sideroxydans sp.]